MNGQVLILTGPPGAGKSTTAAALVTESPVAAVHLHADDFWHFIGKGVIPPYLPEARHQNEVVMAALAAAVSEYARGGFFVVLDGIVGPWLLQPFRGLQGPLHYMVLRPELEDALERCRRRGGGTLTEPGPIRALHSQFSQLGELERHVLDVRGDTPEQTLAAVREGLAGGGYRLARS